jgi:hypothetical protein
LFGGHSHSLFLCLSPLPVFFLCTSLLFLLLFILSLPLGLLFFETYTLSFGGGFLLDSKALGFSFGFKPLTLDLKFESEALCFCFLYLKSLPFGFLEAPLHLLVKAEVPARGVPRYIEVVSP